MNGLPDLAVVLFLPWFLVLGTLYFLFPRQPRHAARRGFDLAVLALALVLSMSGMRWAYAGADVSHGIMWPQVLATLVAYGAFLAVLVLGWGLRALLFTRRPR